MSGLTPLAIEIHPGEHPEWHVFGLTLNADTVWCTVVAGAIVVILGLILRAQLTKKTEDHVPTKLQILWETVVSQVQTQVEDNLGSVNPFVVPLAVALFFFILIANWLELIPSKPGGTEFLAPPTADTNLTYAMAFVVIVGVWGYGIRTKGLGGYLKHFMQPYPALLPLNIIEELVKPVTLALRLFGNIFAGGIMIELLGGLVQISPLHIPVGGFFAVILNVVWRLFDTMFLGGLQAFIFALLTVLYFGMAGAGHDEHTEPDDHTAAAGDHVSPNELAA
jgi:F-type H+-transporting ATPase subunit a